MAGKQLFAEIQDLAVAFINKELGNRDKVIEDLNRLLAEKDSIIKDLRAVKKDLVYKSKVQKALNEDCFRMTYDKDATINELTTTIASKDSLVDKLRIDLQSSTLTLAETKDMLNDSMSDLRFSEVRCKVYKAKAEGTEQKPIRCDNVPRYNHRRLNSQFAIFAHRSPCIPDQNEAVDDTEPCSIENSDSASFETATDFMSPVDDLRTLVPLQASTPFAAQPCTAAGDDVQHCSPASIAAQPCTLAATPVITKQKTAKRKQKAAKRKQKVKFTKLCTRATY